MTSEGIVNTVEKYTTTTFFEVKTHYQWKNGSLCFISVGQESLDCRATAPI